MAADERFLIDGERVDLIRLRELFAPGSHTRASIPPRMRAALELLDLVATKDSVVVDVGAYTGELLEVARATVPHARMIGIDASDDNVRAARSLYPDHSDDFVLGTAYATAQPDESVDVVVLLEVIEHVDRPVDAVRELSRILRHGGHLVLSTPNGASLRHLAQNIVRSYRNQRRERRGQPASLGLTVFDAAVPWNRHLIELSPTSLGMVLQMNGFEIVRHGYVPTGSRQPLLHRLVPAFSGGQIVLARKAGPPPTTFI